MARASVLAFLVSLLGSIPAPAQTCRGSASLQRRPIQLFANGLLGEGANSFAAGLAFGSTGAFGKVELGAIDIDAFNSSSFTFGAGAGYQVPLNKRRSAQLCPTVDAGFAWGPKNINGTGINYSETDLSFGLAAGVVVTDPARQVQVVPTGAIAFVNATSRLTGASGPVSDSQSFGTVSLGVGFVFGQEVSITPSVSRAFGVSGAATTLGVRVAFAFGGARTPVIASPATSCAGLASTDSVVYDTTQVIERPTLRSAPAPRYPPMQRDLGIEGRVIVTVVIGPDGTPDQSSARIVQNVDRAIDREALRWIGSASYWPACREGRPVRARVAQPVDFCRVGCRHR